MEKKTTEEVAQIVESEGLGYAIQSYLSSDSIADPVLAQKWKQAGDLMAEIEAILSPYTE